MEKVKPTIESDGGDYLIRGGEKRLWKLSFGNPKELS